jgi:hypothetical protein
VLLGTLALAGAGGVAQEASPRVPLAQVVEGEVRVDIFIQRVPSGEPRLGATFTALRARFHLYGMDLPKDGVRGLGRPTLLQIVSPSAVEPAGPVVASRPTTGLLMRSLGITLPVYPTGSVTLSLPVRATPEREGGSTEVSITYMACSERTCLPPVVDKRLTVRVPGSMIR